MWLAAESIAREVGGRKVYDKQKIPYSTIENRPLYINYINMNLKAMPVVAALYERWLSFNL